MKKRLFMLSLMILFITAARSQIITNAEYFFDADPGPGNGIAITVTSPGDIVNITANVSTASLSTGFHFIGIRVKDANGKWGLYEARGFYISNATANAANIVAAEYFFDADPGPGSGTSVSVGASGAVVNFTAVIPTSLSAGFHFLAIRTKGADGVWGLYESRGFYTSSATSNAANIVAAEYFIDADPGVGSGTSVSVGTSGAVVNFTAVIPTSVSAGFHFLAIRTKGADGVWGLYETRGFYTSSATANAANIVAAEYFIDADPGVGNGTSVSVGASGAIVNFTAVIPTSLSAGFHFLAIRTKGADGVWGLYESRGFYISSSATDAANVIAAEYFFDTDPGPGNATSTSVGPSGAVVNFTAVIPTSLSTGFHFLGIRTKGADGVWGLYETRGFYISTTTADEPIITAAEYFFDADPGIGNGTPLTITTPGNIVTQTFLIPEPGLSLGTHFLSIRVKDQSGKWGLYEYSQFTVGNSTISCPSNVTVSAPAGQCTAVVNGIDPNIAPPQSFTYTLSGATTGSGSGTASGQTFNAGVTTVAYVLTGSPTVNCSFTVTVNTNIIPSVSVAAAPGNTICSGTNVIFTATPTNGGTPSYQWKLNGGNVGTNSATYQNAALLNGDVVTCVMTSSIACANPNPATSNTITMTVNSTVTPSVSIAAAPGNNICSGTNVVFTATPTNGGTPSYQWKLNGGNVGTNSATYQNAALINGDVITCVMTSSLTCTSTNPVTSNSITMTVTANVTPSVSIAAAPGNNICSGTNVIFTATPTNGGTPSYQWKLNGGNVGTNSATYQNAALANGDVVTCVMTSSIACATPNPVTSNAITMTVTTTITPSVSIAASPGTTICSGTNVTFTATPTNGGTPSYQWKLNGGNVGTNSATYQNASLTNGDVVTCVMTSSLTCTSANPITSNAITITVTSAITPSVAIGAAPGNTICSGTNVTFTATPTNGGTPSYQWKLNGGNVGTNSATYQNSTLINGDVVTCVMTSSIACANPNPVTSNPITMIVTSTVTPSVSIAAAPGNSVCSGTNVTFTATPTNGGTPSYQWKLNGGNVGTNSTTYQNSTLANGDVITCVMTSSLTCTSSNPVTSNAITMTVTANVTPSLTIAAAPGNTICSGTNVVFTATPTNGGTPSYQWKLNGGNVGTNSATYQNSTLANGDIITCVMTSSLPCTTVNPVTSNAITMAVTATVTPSVSIAAAPGNIICPATTVTFTATPTNGGTPSYQWKLNGGNVGTNSATYQNSTLANGDVITCVMTSSLTCTSSNPVTSNSITMTVNSLTVINTQPVSQAVCAGANVTFNVAASGTALTYQWRKAGVNISGATSTSFTITGVTAANAGNYDVVVTGTCGTVTSNTVTLTVNAVTVISAQPVSQTVCSGSNVSFSLIATGTALTYQWRKAGVNIGGAIAATFTINGTVAADAGTYDVIVTGTCGTVTSNSVNLTVTASGTWTGITSNDWNTASNWCGGLPTSTTDVVIPSSTPNMPNLSAANGTVRSISISNGGSVTIGAGGTLDLFGNVTGAGTFNATAGNINFRGSNSQSVPAFTTNNVTMNGAGGVVLGGSSTINGTLTLTNGNISLGSSNLTLASGSSGSVVSHIITNGTGNVIIKALAASASRTIPVGTDAISYNPVTISANAVHTTDDISIRVVAGVLTNGLTGTLYTDKVVDRTWIMDEAVTGGSDVNITLQWTGLQELTGFDRSKCYLMQFSNGTWMTATSTAAAGSDPFTQTKTNVTSFSAFAVQTQPIPRPTGNIYPNPVHSQLNVVVDLVNAGPVTLAVYDAMGRLVLTKQVTLSSGLNLTNINVLHLGDGVYVLKVSTPYNPKLFVTPFVKN